MKKNLNINATRNGKKVSTSIGHVNPDVANSIAGGFAQMVNALTTNTFVNAEVVKKMDTTEEEQQSGGGTGLQEGIITHTEISGVGTAKMHKIDYNGDGQLKRFIGSDTYSLPSHNIINMTNEWGVFYAEATENFTAAVCVFYVSD